MVVRWPDGSVTGSVLATPASAPSVPEPETKSEAPAKGASDKKEVKSDGDQ